MKVQKPNWDHQVTTLILGIVALVLLPLVTVPNVIAADTASETNAYRIKPYHIEPYRIEPFSIIPPVERPLRETNQVAARDSSKRHVERHVRQPNEVTKPNSTAQTSSVPEPTTGLMLVLGLVGFFGFRKKLRS